MKKQNKSKHRKLQDERLDETLASTSSSFADTQRTPIEETDDQNNESSNQLSTQAQEYRGNNVAHQQLEQIFWAKSTNPVEKTREEEFDDYLADLLL